MRKRWNTVTREQDELAQKEGNTKTIDSEAGVTMKHSCNTSEWGTITKAGNIAGRDVEELK